MDAQEQQQYLARVRRKLSEAKRQLEALTDSDASKQNRELRKEIANRLELQRRVLLVEFAHLKGGNAPKWEAERTVFDLAFTDFVHQLDKQFRDANSELFEGNEQLPTAHSAGQNR